jgi:hypothetical protein
MVRRDSGVRSTSGTSVWTISGPYLAVCSIGRLRMVVSTGRRNTLSWSERMECDDGSGLSSRVYGGREDRVMGSLAARGVAQGDRAGVW